MAYNFIRNNGVFLSVSNAVVSQTPLTIAAWNKVTDINTAQAVVSICTNNGTHRFQIVLVANTARYRCNAVGSSATGFAEATASATAGTWGHVAAVFSSDSSRTCYFNGGNSGTSSVTSTLSETLSQVQIGSVYINGNSNYMNGDIAEVGIWNAALTASEVASLGKGITCNQVRPQSLVFYAPLIRDINDIARGVSISNTNSATVSNHPRIYV